MVKKKKLLIMISLGSMECLISIYFCVSFWFHFLQYNIFVTARTGAKSKRDICGAWTMASPWIFGKIKGMKTYLNNDVHK